MSAEVLRPRHSLTRRLLLLLGVLLIAFTLLLSAFYMVIIRRQTVRRYGQSMQRFAYSISQNLYDLYAPYDGEDTLDDTRFIVSEETLAPYLALTEQMTRCNVYIIDPRHNVTGYFDGVVQKLHNRLLPGYIEQTLALGFMGKTPFVRATVEGEPHLTAAAPIMDASSHVLGVVLLEASLRELGYSQVPSTAIFGGSLLVSLALSFLLAALLSRSFTRPIAQLQQFALTLAQGQYEKRIQSEQKDEVGSLAHSMNILAAKLLEARQLDERVKQQQQVFFSNISHELKTPVTVIRGSLEALSDGIVSREEDVRAYYQQMITESRWLQRLIADLLELSRLQSPQFSLEMSSLSLSELVGDVAMSTGALCQQKGLRFSCQPPERDFMLRGDYSRLRQMLLAVADNAVKFTPTGSDIAIEMDADAPIVRVRDMGCGIPKEELPHIFDRFHHTRSGTNDSTGLGLAIAQEVARRHGMAISVRSTEGEGTEFAFDFSGAMINNKDNP